MMSDIRYPVLMCAYCYLLDSLPGLTRGRHNQVCAWNKKNTDKISSIELHDKTFTNGSSS